MELAAAAPHRSKLIRPGVAMPETTAGRHDAIGSLAADASMFIDVWCAIAIRCGAAVDAACVAAIDCGCVCVRQLWLRLATRRLSVCLQRR